MNLQTISKRDVLIGLGAALGLGLVILALVFVLGRSGAAPIATSLPPSATLVVTEAVVPVIEETVTPTPMLSPEVAPTTVRLESEPTLEPAKILTYTVQPDDTLWELSTRFEVSVEALSMASNIIGETIWPGQVLTIPLAGVIVSTPTSPPVSTVTDTPLSTPSTVEVWVPSAIEGDLAAEYPETMAMERFTLHFAPGTYPAQNAAATAAMVTRGLGYIEQTFAQPLVGSFDVYVAGSIFAAPNQALRGFSVSASRRYFFLHDGTGSPADQQYIATHELTHLYAWNVFGRPVSAMLSEGAAVSTGMSAVAGEGHLPLRVFCAAYDLAGVLPRVSANLSFQGHIRDLENYYAAGCFVQYLLDVYGPEKFAQLYPTGDYSGVYGKSLPALESDWKASLAEHHAEVTFEPETLVEAVDAVTTAYEQLFGNFRGTPEEMRAYRVLDGARIALIEGDLPGVDTALAKFHSELSS
ncbi:MAG: LysM peptidoglycan-binding domain-containing protein [Anaerolineae bacterium]|nr:LysM peptidoglycan-binding domain-containing protein [Anaerolineae bacterium]